MDEILNDGHLRWVAAEWRENADRLAAWALERLVNRFDVWGQYTIKQTALGPKVSVVTLPVKELRDQHKDMVSTEKLVRHFKGQKVSHLIGLHCVSEDETCLWFAVDLDVHDEVDFAEKTRRNFAAATHWYRKLRAAMLDPCIVDSNGRGGLHLICLLDRPYPLADVHGYLKNLVGDYADFGLERAPEIFPSSDRVEGLGKWLRLPGRHHTHPHFSKVWDEDEPDDPWLEGISAIEHLLSLRPMPLPETKRERRPSAKRERQRRAVCVDLDGVLARYDGWNGPDKIGKPIAGAREFLESLKEKYRVVVYSSRLSSDSAGREEILRTRHFIEKWLTENSLPFDEVYAGIGKPLAVAFIDDRAVRCRPQDDPEAYEKALKSLERG